MNQENAELDVEMPPDELVEQGEDLDCNRIGDESPSQKQNIDIEIKEIVPDDEIFKDAPPQKKPKRKATEKQKAHLAKIRVKALEAKKKKREAKKATETPKIDVQPPESDPTEKSENPKPLEKSEVPPSMVHLTPQQLRQLQIEAIGGYDQMRKNRKEKKKKEEAKARQEKEVYKTISKAVKPHDDDGWGVCFQ